MKKNEIEILERLIRVIEASNNSPGFYILARGFEEVNKNDTELVLFPHGAEIVIDYNFKTDGKKVYNISFHDYNENKDIELRIDKVEFDPENNTLFIDSDEYTLYIEFLISLKYLKDIKDTIEDAKFSIDEFKRFFVRLPNKMSLRGDEYISGLEKLGCNQLNIEQDDDLFYITTSVKDTQGNESKSAHPLYAVCDIQDFLNAMDEED